MKSIRHNIVFFTYDNKIDARSNKFLIQEILQLTNIIKPQKLKGIFISLKRVDCNLTELKKLISLLEEVSKKLPIPIALGNYTHKLFNILKVETNLTRVKLFKNEDIAKLLFNPSLFKTPKKILIFDDGDEKDIDKISSILGTYGHTMTYEKNLLNFVDKVENKVVDFAIYQTKINFLPRTKQFNTPRNEKRTLALSQKTINNLPVFTDTAIDTLTTVTNFNAVKISHEIKSFNSLTLENTISSIMSFRGDLEGHFVLIFPLELAYKSIEAMIDEQLNESCLDEIIDGISEFCNLITGSTKTILSDKNVNVLFDLPQTTTCIDTTTDALPQNNGIWIDMELENMPFYMYITK